MLEDLAPVQQAQLTQAGKGVAAGQLIPGLPVLFLQIQLKHGSVEHAFQPALHRGEGCRLIVEQADQLYPEIGGGMGFGLGKFRQDSEQLIGIAAIGGDQPVGPEIGQLPFAQILKSDDGQALDAFDERQSHHLGDRPEFATGQGADRLIRLDELNDIHPVQTHLSMGDQILGQTIDAGQSMVGISGENRQLPVKMTGKIEQNIADITFENVLVVQNPISCCCGLLLQIAGGGEIGADLANPFSRLFESTQQFGGMLLLGIHPLLAGVTPGMLQNLRRGEFDRCHPLLHASLLFGMEDEQCGWRISDFPEQRHRILQGVYRSSKDKHRLAGQKPAGMVTDVSRINTL